MSAGSPRLFSFRFVSPDFSRLTTDLWSSCVSGINIVPAMAAPVTTPPVHRNTGRYGKPCSSRRRHCHDSDDSFSDSASASRSRIRRNRRNSDSDVDDTSKLSSKRKISELKIADYLAKMAQKRATKGAKIVKSRTVSGYSNDSDPFGDSNLNEKFVWRKKIQRDVTQGVPLDEFSVKAEKRRQRERMAEIEKVKKRRQERAIEKARHEEEMALLARERARAEIQDWEKKEEEFHFDQSKIRSEIRLRLHEGRAPLDEGDAGFGLGEEINLDSLVYWWHDKYHPRKLKYFNRVHTGYEWNKSHYDHDNSPPKMVQGYKFNIFCPDLVDKSKAPSYTIEKDGDSADTCIIRFHAGPPYEDIAFRIVNKEWEYSHKKGFKCT